MSKQYHYLIAISVVTMLLSGCVTQGSIQNDIDETHEEAYRTWEHQNEVASDSAAAKQELSVNDTSKTETQPVVTGKLGLEDALKLGLLYNRNLEQVIEEQTFARGRQLAAYGDVLPNISVNGTYTRQENVNQIGDITLGALNNYSATLSVQQPIFSGGGLVAGLRAAEYYEALTDENIKAQAEQTIYQTQSIYLQALLLQEQYNVSQERVELSKAALNDVQNQQEYGTASEYNVLRAKVDVANARTQMINIKNSFEQTISQLLMTLGVSQESNISINDSLTYEPINWNKQEAVRTALLNRPDLAGSNLSVELQEESLRSAYSNYLPTVSAYFDNSWGRPSPVNQTLNDWGRVWNAGLTVQWSIFNLNREGNIIQQKSNLRQQQISYLNTREQVLFDVNSAILSLDNTREAVEAQELTLEQAREGLRLARAQFREGTINQVALLDAQQSLTEAQFNYYSSLHDYAVAKLDLNQATGELSLEVSQEAKQSVPVLRENE